MVDVVILADFEEGHVIPTFKLANNLLSHGISVTYLGIPDAKLFINNQGFKAEEIFQDMYPKGYIRKMRAHKKAMSSVDINEYYLAIATGRLDDIMNRLKPKLIISSSFIALEALLLHYRYGIEQIIYHTFFPPIAESPPKNLAEMSVSTCIQNFMELSGNAPDTILSFIQNANRNFKSFDDLVAPLLDMFQLMVCPKSLITNEQPIGDKDIYLGPCIREGSPEEIQSATRFLPKDKSAKLIFASMGSQIALYPDRADRFFNIAIDCMKHKQMQQYHMIISVGSEENKRKFDVDHGNISVFPWVPQTELLQHVDLAIIHGGLGSIKECIYHKVPMLIVPMGRDQIDNGQRVLINNLGLVEDIEALSPERLSTLVSNIFTNDTITESLGEASNSFRKADLEKDDVKLISKLIGNTVIPT